MVINDLLCYSFNKFSRIPLKTLKTTILDFYSNSDISVAKDTLVAAFEEIGHQDKSFKIPRRRKDSIGRTNSEIDDICSVIAYADENALLDKFPMYVSADPDKMPSVKLTDGDLALMLAKLSKIESGIANVKETVDTIINKPMQNLTSHSNTTKAMPIGNPVKTSANPQLHHQSASMSHQTVPSAKTLTPRERTIIQSDMRRDSDITDSMDVETTSDDENGSNINPWFRKESKRQASVRKRMRQSDSPETQRAVMQTDNTAQPAKARAKKTAIFGASTTSALKASANLKLPKAVYLIGNLSGSLLPEDVKSFLTSVNVRVVTCF